jgi:hypothetical protein
MTELPRGSSFILSSGFRLLNPFLPIRVKLRLNPSVSQWLIMFPRQFRAQSNFGVAPGTA